MHDRSGQGTRARSRGRPRLAGLVGALALTLAVAACAGGDDTSDGVASLTGSKQPTSTTNAGGSKDPRQAALEFSRCMRQHGIDMPDPKFGADGSVTMEVRPGGGPAPDDATFKRAQQECQKHLQSGGQPIKPDPQQLQQALRFARCMRQHGIDMPDPNTNGGIVVQGGSGRANRNGPKPDDQKFKAAQEACKQYLPGGAGGLSTNTGGGGQ